MSYGKQTGQAEENRIYGIARMRARFVCPICEKITPGGKTGELANLRKIGKGLTGIRWLWTCKHCGATHRDQEERILK